LLPSIARRLAAVARSLVGWLAAGRALLALLQGSILLSSAAQLARSLCYNYRTKISNFISARHQVPLLGLLAVLNNPAN
jgi:hypothetical protein